MTSILAAFLLAYTIWGIFRWRDALVLFLAVLPLVSGLRPMDGLPEASIYRLLLLPILAGFFLQAAVRRRDLSIRPVSVSVAVWVGVNVVASFTSLDVAGSLKRTLTLLEYLPLLYMVAAIQESPSHARRSRIALVVGFVAVVAYGAIEAGNGTNFFFDANLLDPVLMEQDYVHLHERAGSTRIAGPMGQPINMGLYLAMMTPLALAVLARLRARLKWLLLGGLLFAALWLEYRTFSRGPWVGAAVALFSSVSLWSWHRRTVRGVVVLLAILLAGTVAASFAPPDLQAFISRSLGDDSRPDANISGRTQILRTTAEILADRPVLGLGPGVVFHYLADTRGGPLARYGGIAGLENQYAYVALDTGLAGLAAYLLLLWSLVRLALRAYRRAVDPVEAREQLAIVAACVTFVVTAATVQTAGFQTMMLVAVVGYSFAATRAVPAHAGVTRMPSLTPLESH